MSAKRLVLLVVVVLLGGSVGVLTFLSDSWSLLGVAEAYGADARWAVNRDSIADLGNGVYGAWIRLSYDEPRLRGWTILSRDVNDFTYSLQSDTITRLGDDVFGSRIRMDPPDDEIPATGEAFDHEIWDVEFDCGASELRFVNGVRYGPDGGRIGSDLGNGGTTAATPGTPAEIIAESVCESGHLREAQMGDSVETWDPVFSFDNVTTRYEIDCEGHRVREGSRGWYRLGKTLISSGDQSRPFFAWEDAVPESIGELMISRVCRLAN